MHEPYVRPADREGVPGDHGASRQQDREEDDTPQDLRRSDGWRYPLATIKRLYRRNGRRGRFFGVRDVRGTS